MKFIHLSDLHLGKRVNEFSLLEDQQYILGAILKIVRGEKPDAVVIAGDVYDKPVPPAEAVTLLDSFLVSLSGLVPQTLVISGNHDSAERMAFGGRLMEKSGVRLCPAYGGSVEPVVLSDAHGPVFFYLIPFLKPSHVRRFFPDREISSYTDALAAVIGELNVDEGARSVIVTHQFVTGASRCDSEEISVGGSDNVDASVFDPFDYAALGHLHNPQSVGRETVRYCGTPLKYSFSEAGCEKSVTVVELGEKGSVSVRAVPLRPLRDMVELRGTYSELTLRDFYTSRGCRNDYVHITLTDEDDVPDAMGKLRLIYPNLMRLDYDNRRTRAAGLSGEPEDAEQKSPLDLLEEFYEKQNGQAMGEEQRALARRLVEEIWEGEA